VIRRMRPTVPVAVIVAAVFLTLAAPAGATSIATLQAQVANARSQARTLASTVQLRTAQFHADAAAAAGAAQRLAAVENELANGRARVARLQRQVAIAQAHLRVAQARFRREQKKLSDRLVAIYKSGTPDVAGLLLNATSFSDLLTRETYLQRIAEIEIGVQLLLLEFAELEAGLGLRPVGTVQ